MRIAIITGRRPHHKNLCVRLAEHHELVAVIHPTSSVPTRNTVLRRHLHDRGLTGRLLRVRRQLQSIPAARRSSVDSEEVAQRFPEAEAAYARLDATTIHDLDPNGAKAIDVFRAASPEVVVCLGGPVFRQPLIDASPLMINFHSGLSPLYNGTSAIDFAFANGHPHLCGGTLMVMSPVVDGGDILAHFLPAIEESDTPGTLFAKCVAGSVAAFDRFLEAHAAGQPFAKAPQPPPLFYYRGRDWTTHHANQVARHVERGTVRKFLRPQELVEYWRAPDDALAAERVNETVLRLLGLR
jgi:folate-dependent phosphoribosylglycinamide formyltransferase PurN